MRVSRPEYRQKLFTHLQELSRQLRFYNSQDSARECFILLHIMLRYSEEEGRTLASNVIRIFAAQCGKEYLAVFLNVFENERQVLRDGLGSFLAEVSAELGPQDKQSVCKNFFSFCRHKAESFWLVEFWLSHDSICTFSLQNEESLEMVLNMFFDFYCDFVQDILSVVHRQRIPRPSEFD